MDPIRGWFAEDRGRRAAEALKKRDFNAHYVETQDQAKEMILKEVPPRGNCWGWRIGYHSRDEDFGRPESQRA
jgi:hypothetical protein